MDQGYKRLPRVNREIKKNQTMIRNFEKRRQILGDSHTDKNVAGYRAIIARLEVEKAEIESRGWTMYRDGTAVQGE